MRGIVVEITGKYAVILTQDGLFKKIKARPDMAVGAEIDTGRPAKAAAVRRPMYRIASIAASLLLVLGISMYIYSMPYSYVDFDINPSIGLTANIFDRIIRVEALNEDGNKLIENRNLVHMKLERGITLLIDSAVEQGYLIEEADEPCEDEPGNADQQDAADIQGRNTDAQNAELQDTEPRDTETGDTAPQGSADGQQSEGGMQSAGGTKVGNNSKETKDPAGRPGKQAGNTGKQAAKQPPKQTEKPSGSSKLKNAVMLTVSSPNAKKSGELKKKMEDTAARELSKGKVESKIIVGETSVKQREAAHKLGVTPGKLVLIEEVSGYFSGADFEKMKNTAVKDLLEMVRGKKEDQHPQKPEEKKDEAEKGKKESGAADKSASGAGGNAGATHKGNGNDKDKEKSSDKDKARDKDKGGIGSGIGIGSGVGGGKNTGGSKNTGSGSTDKNTKPGSGQAGLKEGKTGDSKPGAGAVENNDKKAGSVRDSKSTGKQNSNTNSKQNSSIGKQNDNKKKTDPKPGMPSWDDVKKELEKQGEELKKEREQLRKELIEQITNDKPKAGGNTAFGPGRSGAGPAGDSKDNKKESDRNSTGKNDNSGKSNKDNNKNNSNSNSNKNSNSKTGKSNDKGTGTGDYWWK